MLKEINYSKTDIVENTPVNLDLETKLS